MEPISARIKAFADEKRLSIRQIELSIGASNGLLSKSITKNTDILSIWVSKIIETYPEINPLWLLIGEGEMLKDAFKTAHIPPSTAEKSLVLGQKKHIPPSLQGSFVRNSVRNLSGNEDKNETSYCAQCEMKERIIQAKNDLIEAIKMDNKLMEKLVEEKEKRIAMLTSQIEEQQHVSATKSKKAG